MKTSNLDLVRPFGSLIKTIKKKSAVLINFCFLLLLICLCRDTLITKVKWNFYVVSITLTLICYAYFLVYFMIRRFKARFSKDSIIIAGLIIVCVFLTMIVNRSFQMMDFYFLMSVSIAFLYCSTVDITTFCKSYIAVIVFLGSYSLICFYILKNVFILYHIPIPVDISVNNVRFLDFGFSFVLDTNNYYRNFGIFREPGVFQFFIITALIMELLFIKRKYLISKIIVSIILIGTMLSTFAIGGWIETAMVVAIFLIAYIAGGKNKVKILLFTAAIGALIICFILILCKSNSYFYWTLQSTLTKVVTLNESSTARIDSIFVNVKAWLSGFLFGHGPKYVFDLTPDNTSTTGQIFAIFGTLIGLIHLYLFYGIPNRVQGRLWIKISIFFVLLLSVNTEMLFTNQFFWVLSFTMFMKSDRNNNDIIYTYLKKIWFKLRRREVKAIENTLEHKYPHADSQ
jgi:hypothetical protein